MKAQSKTEYSQEKGNKDDDKDKAPVLKVIQIQTIDMCNRSCDFCPNKYDIRKTGNIMREDIFYKILDELKKIKFKGRISTYLMNEPLLDSRLPELIQTIRREFPANLIFLNSNGDKIYSSSLRNRLAESGLDALHINCYDGKEEYKKKVEVVESWAEKDHRIKVHHSGSMRKMEERNGSLNVRVKCFTKPKAKFWNRAGYIPSVAPKRKHKLRGKCNFPFEQLYINYLGQAVLCCSDYKFEVVFGSVVEQSLMEIWNSRGYRMYRAHHEKGNVSELPLCRSCNRTISTE